jgi:predicted RNA methylase
VWQQAVQWLDPVSVVHGTSIVLEASHNSTRIRFQLVSPCRAGPPIVHRHTVARWHFEMVADELRNAKYEAAIVRAVGAMRTTRRGAAGDGAEGRVSVVDFGTGTGLLAMMAARAGATRVDGFELSEHLSSVARRVVKRNGYSKVIHVTQKDCRQIAVGHGRDLPDRADLLIMELFDYGFLGEGALHFAHFAWNHVLEDDARIVPQGGAVFAMAVQIAPREMEGFDVSMWGAYRFQTEYYAIDLASTSHRRLSAPFRVFDFDFRRAAAKDSPPTSGGAWSGDLDVIADGVLNAIVFWHEIRLDEETTISTAPGDVKTCWFQAVQPMEELSLSKGTTLALNASHQGSRITFAIDRSKMDDYEAMRTAVPFFGACAVKRPSRRMLPPAVLPSLFVSERPHLCAALDRLASPHSLVPLVALI